MPAVIHLKDSYICSEIVLLVSVLIAELRCCWRILVLIDSFLLLEVLHCSFMLCYKRWRTRWSRNLSTQFLWRLSCIAAMPVNCTLV